MSYLNYDNTTDKPWGEIEFTWKDGGTPASKVSMLAHTASRELLFAGIIAESQRVKQIRAAVSGCEKSKENVRAAFSGQQTNKPGQPDWYATRPNSLLPTKEGYFVYQQRLAYGMAYAFFVTKMQGFLLVLSEEALWRELTSLRYTTPVLRHWLPYIEKQLRAENKLDDAYAWNCRCGILTATTADLDRIVEDGLRERKILIAPESESESEAA